MKKLTIIFNLFVLTISFVQAQTITIGDQVWSTKNLDVSTFRNGDPIPEARTQQEWSEAGFNEQPAWCYYNNTQANGLKYGKLYNWYAIIDPRGLAPNGWRIPSRSDVMVLLSYTGGKGVAGDKLKSINDWSKIKGTNSIGFNALPGGWRDHLGHFVHVDYTGNSEPQETLGQHGNWWTTSATEDAAICFYLSNLDNEVHLDSDLRSYGLSVRLIKTKENTKSTDPIPQYKLVEEADFSEEGSVTIEECTWGKLKINSTTIYGARGQFMGKRTEIASTKSGTLRECTLDDILVPEKKSEFLAKFNSALQDHILKRKREDPECYKTVEINYFDISDMTMGLSKTGIVFSTNIGEGSWPCPDVINFEYEMTFKDSAPYLIL